MRGQETMVRTLLTGIFSDDVLLKKGKCFLLLVTAVQIHVLIHVCRENDVIPGILVF